MPLVMSLLVALMFSATPAAAQEETTTQNQLRVYIDGACWFCDRDYLRRELTWVDYVRDPSDAQVHLIGTNQGTGGGTEYVIHFIGVNALQGTESRLRYSSSQTDTDAERREGVTQIITIGLLNYAALAEVVPDLEITFNQAVNPQARFSAQDDPWDYWVFSIRAGGNIRGETRQQGYSVDGRISADRITEEWKLEFDASGRYNHNETELSDTTFVNTSRNWELQALIVRSVTDHWSVGGRAEVGASTFNNQDLRAIGAVAIEYSIFPYAESSTRQYTFLYSIGPSYFDWEEITIFDQAEELRFRQSLEGSLGLVQPWGRANFFGSAESFLHDLSLHSLSLGGGLNFRVTRGLNLGLNGSVARIKDQISLQRGGISDEDILVRRRQLGTDYRFNLRFNLTYRFGSIFNNVVNPRIDF